MKHWKMNKTSNVPVSEIRRVYLLLEKLQDLFHQPLKFEVQEQMRKFAKANYKEIHDLYYQVVWHWLPEEKKAIIADDEG